MIPAAAKMTSITPVSAIAGVRALSPSSASWIRSSTFSSASWIRSPGFVMALEYPAARGLTLDDVDADVRGSLGREEPHPQRHVHLDAARAGDVAEVDVRIGGA